MSRGAHKFRQTEVSRAIRAARAAGENIVGVKISPKGEIVLIFGKTSETHSDNEWDAVYEPITS